MAAGTVLAARFAPAVHPPASTPHHLRGGRGQERRHSLCKGNLWRAVHHKRAQRSRNAARVGRVHGRQGRRAVVAGVNVHLIALGHVAVLALVSRRLVVRHGAEHVTDKERRCVSGGAGQNSRRQRSGCHLLAHAARQLRQAALAKEVSVDVESLEGLALQHGQQRLQHLRRRFQAKRGVK